MCIQTVAMVIFVCKIENLRLKIIMLEVQMLNKCINNMFGEEKTLEFLSYCAFCAKVDTVLFRRLQSTVYCILHT